MSLLVLGINHKTASVAVREKVAFAPDALKEAHRQLVQLPSIDEAVIVSTCNRSELYARIHTDDAKHELLQWLANYHSISAIELQQCCYWHHGLNVVQHLGKVASGLDSLVLGEPQILGQLKSAWAVAQDAATCHSELNQAFQHSFSIAKHVRTETAIGHNPVSVAYAAVSLSGHIFADLSQCTALLIGAGETIDLVARHLREKKIKQIIIANRTLTRAEDLAREFNAQAILLSDIPDYLASADIVISSTASQLPILGKGAVESAIKKRRRKPMYLVDIAVPRDIEAEVADINDAYLYTVDDLQKVIAKNVKSRQQAAHEAEELISQGVQDYQRMQKERAAADVIKRFRDSILAIRDDELDKALRQLASGKDADQVLARFAHNLTNKLIHKPSVALRQASAADQQHVLDVTEQLFALDKHQ